MYVQRKSNLIRQACCEHYDYGAQNEFSDLRQQYMILGIPRVPVTVLLHDLITQHQLWQYATNHPYHLSLLCHTWDPTENIADFDRTCWLK